VPMSGSAGCCPRARPPASRARAARAAGAGSPTRASSGRPRR
jgi:hypothetical protein